jgi:hypothetical protein
MDIWLFAQSIIFPIRKELGPRRAYISSIYFAHSMGEVDVYSAILNYRTPFSS